ncbi:rCG33890, isoform CRA_b, partial [Rattus norvegicus]
MNSPNESDGMSGREPSLEILPRTPLHSIPVAGDLGQAYSLCGLTFSSC